MHPDSFIDDTSNEVGSVKIKDCACAGRQALRAAAEGRGGLSRRILWTEQFFVPRK